MSYQVLPNIIFIFAVLGILFIILRRLPEALPSEKTPNPQAEVQNKLLAKGLPAEALSKFRVLLKLWSKKIWNFMLEAKDLKPHATVGYRMKKIFRYQLPNQKRPLVQPLTTHEVKNEQYYLDMIKIQPKNLEHYDALGKFYLGEELFSDAKDVYIYLAGHEPANADYHARLAYCFYQNREYQKAGAHYKKSLALDSTHPNRYYNLALCLEAGGNFTEAIQSYEQAILFEPSTKYYLNLSNVYLKAGNAQKAKEALLLAKKVDPKNQVVESKLGRFVKV